MSSSHVSIPSLDSSLKPPLGLSDFGELHRGGYTYVDKTLFVREVLEDSAKVTLITRPRRFGKTLNLSMLHHFFAEEVRGEPTHKIFDYLAVSKDKEVMAHQGQYSVIFITLKDIKEQTFAAALAKLADLLATVFSQHRELVDSPSLTPEYRDSFRLVLKQQSPGNSLASSLKLLCTCLNAHHGKPVMLLIDEYDTPMHAGYSHGYLDDIVGFMRGFLGTALKDNSFLHKAVVTGILRVSKENLFSGLNNVEVNTVLSRDYSRWFGFTEKDVAELLTLLSREIPDSVGIGEHVKAWYNGYRFGEQVVYNPWSILSCLKHDGQIEPYWVNTSDNALLKEVTGRATAEIKEQLGELVRGGSIEQSIDANLVFADLMRGGDAVWSLLLFTGYLTAVSRREVSEGDFVWQLKIPNQEVLKLYERLIKEWFTDGMSSKGYEAFLQSLLAGNLDEFKARLEDYLRDSMSVFDTSGHHPEKFYHGLALGLMFGLRETHIVYSNRESGYGRYDLALLPRMKGEPGLIMEFKRVADAALLDEAAAQALEQIDSRWYQAELRQHDVARVRKIGMAFSGKRVAIRAAAG